MKIAYMKWAAVVLAGAMAGCSTPSVHPIYSENDTPLAAPGLVGTWKDKNGAPTYTLTSAGENYHLLVKSNDARSPERWEFAVRLVKIDEANFADFSAVEEERKTHDDHWGSLFVPTHMFARWLLEGDSVTVWLPKREWLEKALAEKTVTLGHTRLGGSTILITAETAELRAFLKKYGTDAGAFADQVKLERVKP